MIAFYEVDRFFIFQCIEQGIDVLPQLGQKPVQQVTGDCHHIEIQRFDGPQEIPPVLPIATVMEIGHLQDGKAVEGFRQTIQLYFRSAHVETVGVPPAVQQHQDARYNNNDQRVEHDSPFRMKRQGRSWSSFEA